MKFDLAKLRKPAPLKVVKTGKYTYGMPSVKVVSSSDPRAVKGPVAASSPAIEVGSTTSNFWRPNT